MSAIDDITLLLFQNTLCKFPVFPSYQQVRKALAKINRSSHFSRYIDLIDVVGRRKNINTDCEGEVKSSRSCEWNKIKTTATTLRSLCWKKNFLKVNLSSIMFVLILVSSEKQPLMRVEQNKNNSNYIKVFVLEKNFLKVNLSSIMFVLILVSSLRAFFLGF